MKGAGPETIETKASVQIFAEDCLSGMNARLADGSVDVVVTSPPYNLGVAYTQYEDDRPANEYMDWIEQVALGVKRVLSDQGSFFLNLGSTPQNPWAAFDVAQRVRKHFILQNQILWVKSIAITRDAVGNHPRMTGDIAVGHYKPVNSRRYMHSGYEYVFQFTKSGEVPLDRLAVGVPYQDKSNISRWGGAADKRCRGNVWFVPYKTIQSRESDRPHPAAFPVELAEMCLKLHGVEKTRLAMDPFLGIGSAAVAAKRLGLPFVGFEIDPGYAAEAQKIVEREVVK